MNYTGEIIEFDNKKFKVIDVDKISFENAVFGIKNKLTKVIKAKKNEKIITKNNKGEIESIETANEGDAIFCNSENDRYIPRDINGNNFKYNCIEDYRYKIVERHSDYIMVQSLNFAKLLVGVIKENSCIKNAFGKGVHQFLYPGATLKKDLVKNKVTGIDKDAFEATWLVVEKDEFNL